MNPPESSDPTLELLRTQFAAGNVDGARRALLQLSSEARAELEARLGAPTMARIMQTSRRSRGRINGRVVVIHGIMGGKLASVDASGDEDLVWVNFFRLASGRIGAPTGARNRLTSTKSDSPARATASRSNS